VTKPLKGEIWLIRLDPTEGHEQSKTRPCLIISNNKFNKSAVDLVFIAPLTSKNKQIPLHVKILKQVSRLPYDSFIMPEQIRSLSTNRCIKKIGDTNETILSELQNKIKVILDIE
jgi:mRNA interferase MazF